MKEGGHFFVPPGIRIDKFVKLTLIHDENTNEITGVKQSV